MNNCLFRLGKALVFLAYFFVLEGNINEYFVPDFNESMSWNKRYKPNLRHNIIARGHNIIARELYNQYLQEWKLHEPALIPEIVHHIWLGSALPQGQQVLFKTWIEHHPNWYHVLWTDNKENYQHGTLIISSINELQELLKGPNFRGGVIVVDISNIRFECQDLIDSANNYGEISDIMRYEILYNVGGLYVDTDYECLKSFNVLHRTCKFIIGMYLRGNIMNSLIASQPTHPILGLAIERLKQKDPEEKITGKPQTEITFEKTGPRFLTRAIFDFIASKKDIKYPLGVVLFPVTYFYPWPHFERLQKKEQIAGWIKNESFAVHHWHCSWFKNSKNQQ